MTLPPGLEFNGTHDPRKPRYKYVNALNTVQYLRERKMGRQSEISNETTTKTLDSSALSAIGNSPDLVTSLKAKTGA